MAQDINRRILRPTEHQPASATIIGVVPQIIEDQLKSSNDDEELATTTVHGRIDASGLAYAISNSGTAIVVWEHVQATLTEQILQPNRGSVLEHPEYFDDDEEEEMMSLEPLTPDLVCLASYGGTTNSSNLTTRSLTTTQTQTQGSRITMPSYSLLACSPNGVICLWSNALGALHDNINSLLDDTVAVHVPCASVRLPLQPNESVVSLVAAEPAGFFATTDLGRVWMVLRRSRPLELLARLFSTSSSSSSSASITATNDISTGGSMFMFGTVGRMLFGTNTNNDAANAALSAPSPNNNSKKNQHRIFLLPLPEYIARADQQQQQSDTSDTSATPLSLRRPARRQRLAHAIQPTRSFIAVHCSNASSIHMAKYTVLVEGPDQRTERTDAQVNLLPNIQACIAQNWSGTGDDSNLAIMVMECCMARGNTSSGYVILACRVQRVSDGVCRLYLVQCSCRVETSTNAAATDDNDEPQLHQKKTDQCQFGVVMSCQWLSKISTQDAATIPCCGLVATENIVLSSGGWIAYSFWQQQNRVAVCAVHFPEGGAALLQRGEHQALYDFVLPEDVSAVAGFGQTSMSEGGLLMADTGCVISVAVRPKEPSILMTTHPIQSTSVSNVNVQNLKSHLLDLFHQAYSRMADGEPIFTATTSPPIPPSLAEADAASLDATVSAVSNILVEEDMGPSLTEQDAVAEKLKKHECFVNFLKHTGIFLKISSARCILSEHGEIIAATAGLLELRDERSSIGGAHMASFAMHLRNLATNCTQLVNRLRTIQDVMLSSDRSIDVDETSKFANEVSFVLCQVYGSATVYRRSKIEHEMYEIPNHSSPTYIPPWICGENSRKLLRNQLSFIKQLAKINDDTMFQVETIGIALLQTYEAEALKNRNSELFVKSFNDARALAIPMLRQYVNAQFALDTSIKCHYFEGIVSLCNEMGNPGREKLGKLMAGDMRTVVENGSAFPRFVFSWYTDRSQVAYVLDLGKYCPQELRRFLSENCRVSDHAWINDVRCGRWDEAQMNLSKVGESTETLMDKKLFLSLRKIASIVSQKAPASSANSGLQLIQAQEMLMDAQSDGPIACLPAAGLMQLAMNHVADTSRGYDDRIRAGLAGLAVAEVMQDGAKNAALIWEKSLQCERTLWKDIASFQESNAESDMKEAMSTSVFFGISKEYSLNDTIGLDFERVHKFAGLERTMMGLALVASELAAVSGEGNGSFVLHSNDVMVDVEME